MSLKLTHGEYVKFVRTTSAVWNNVPNNDKNTDTLYFVLAADRTYGDLYLGPTLITGVDSTFTLSQISDVLDYDPDDIANGSLLMWDDDTQTWTPTSLFDALQSITDSISVMGGATSVTNGARGLVPDQPAGTQDWYLSGSGQWVNPVPRIQTVVNNLASNWFGDDWSAQDNALADGQTVRDIAADEVAKIVADAPEAFDTLKEIADWIHDQPTVQDITGLVSRVTSIETRLFTDVPANPDTGAAAQISLVHQVNNLSSDMTTVKSDITVIKESLKWQDMTEESD